VLPLTLSYLHQAKGIPLPAVGLLLAGSGALGLVAVPLAGGCGAVVPLIGVGPSAVWIRLLSAGCLGTVLLGVRLGRQLGPRQDRLEEAPRSAGEPALT
jgi:hypothetical protein